ncbi:MAG: PAS domain S-box protein [Planctomycetes bacterium]|nr:PAS domain S-box protein [Planctomycetota bacterium]
MHGIARGLSVVVGTSGALGAAEAGGHAFLHGLLFGALFSLVVPLVCLWWWWRQTRGRSALDRQPDAAVEVPAFAPRSGTPPAVVARRRHETTERTTEVLIRQGLPAARLGSWEHDLARNRITWSEHIHEIFGRLAETMPATFEELMAIVHPDDRASLVQRAKRLGETGIPVGSELRVVWPDGSIHWQATRAELERDAQGQPLRVTGIAMDITERKHIEDELRQSQRLLSVGFDAAHIGAWEWDQRSGRMTWSGQVEAIFGLAPGTFSGTFEGYLALIHPGDLTTVQSAIERAMAEGGGFQVEHRVTAADGSIRWLAGRGDVLRGSDETFTGMAGVVLDVTNRRLAEQELRDSEGRYRAVITAMHEGVVVHRPDGRIIDANRSAAEILGLSLDQLVTRDNADPRWSMVHEDGSPFTVDEFPNVIAQRSGKPQHHTTMGVHRPDGTTRWLSVNADPLLSLGGGTPLGAVVTYSDITDRLHHERAMRDSEERLRSLAEHNPNTISMVDRTGTILYVNRTYPGIEINQVLGTNVRDYIQSETLGPYLVALERVFTGGSSGEVELQVRTPTGETIWFLSSLGPLRSGGRIIAAVVTSIDITERRRDLEERRRFQSERETMFERMPIGCILWTRERRISYANPAAEQIFGFAADGMNGHGPDLLNFEEGMPEVSSYFERIEKGDMGLVAEMNNRKADGSEVHCEWHPTPLFTATGELTGVITMVMDISERSSLEEQLRQSQKMEAVGRLAGGIAHDFNNLLTAIMGYGELLETRIPSTDQASGYVQQIKKAARRAAALTYQLLAFSRKQVLQAQLLVVGDVITDLEPMLRRLIGEHITLKTDMEQASWQVLADAGQLEQVVMNLVVNARDAMPTGGSLTITTRNRHLDADMVRAYAEVPPGDYVMMTVSDTGEGMEDNVKKRIFEPFFTTKPEGKGTGLGLAVVFGVVRQSGGFIFVDSVPTKGSRFDVLLPRADKAPEPFRHRDSTAQLAIRGSETILLVEDDEGVRGLARDTLEASGYTVLAVSNGQEAIEISEHYPKPIELLLTDVVMPGLGGREVAEQVKRKRPAIRVLFMSGYTDDLVLTHGVADGTAAFIEKPFAAPKLLGRIRKLLSGQV